MDIELVIKISEEDFKIMKHNIAVNNPLCPLSQEEMVAKVANGTPLPKGHGRLIDMRRLQKFVSDYTEYDAVQLILADREDYLPTILEADKESEE